MNSQPAGGGEDKDAGIYFDKGKGRKSGKISRSASIKRGLTKLLGEKKKR